jgi:hypothetical protein
MIRKLTVLIFSIKALQCVVMILRSEITVKDDREVRSLDSSTMTLQKMFPYLLWVCYEVYGSMVAIIFL